MNDTYDFEVKNLNEKFYQDYPESLYPEILRKEKRSYNCIVFETHYNYYVCIPFRTQMKHKYGYHFKNSIRSTNNSSGLDFSKMIIISNPEYFSDGSGIVDNDEYNEMSINIEKIARKAMDYLNEYIAVMKNDRQMNPAEFNRKYSFSTLKYFHNLII